MRCRGKEGRYTYTCTVRRPEKAGQIVEVKSSLSKKVYGIVLNEALRRGLLTESTFARYHKSFFFELDLGI